MNARTASVWTVFGAAVAAVFGALLLATWTALDAARLEAIARHEAAQEEAARLAIGRMDFSLALLLGQESARPWFTWRSCYSLRGDAAANESPVLPGEALISSPLLGEGNAFALLYFQVNAAGEVSAPRVPPPELRALVEPSLLSPADMGVAAQRLAELTAHVRHAELVAQLPEPPRSPSRAPLAPPEAIAATLAQRGQPAAPPDPTPQVARQGSIAPQQQQEQALSDNEVQARQRSFQNYQTFGNVRQIGSDAAVRVGALSLFWVDDRLLAARRVVGGDADAEHVGRAREELVQGFWVDWSALRTWLEGEVSDLLPDARLLPALPASSARAAQRERRLALLPAQLDFPAREFTIAGLWTPAHTWLGVAWIAALLAAGAVAVLLAGLLALAERRAAFVSSVTHELRTPLTTFRIYTEMLAGGMVPDASRQREYLDTLQSEALRLGHLVENVLGYARVERGRATGPVTAQALGALLDRAAERLAQRAAQSELTLRIDVPTELRDCRVLAEATAVEQILFNLVDNACKYGRRRDPDGTSPLGAAKAGRADVEITARVGSRGIDLRVRDYGAGLTGGHARRIFGAFHKSAREAAQSAPGVGLGLALSRRLARWMGGDLRHESPPDGGACFVLHLKRGQAPRE